jgi:hypothetical protein
VREPAIEKIGQDCIKSGKVEVVTGHYMFWKEHGKEQVVWTNQDSKTYTHILYLDVPTEIVAQRCQSDSNRSRLSASVYHLGRWQSKEKVELISLCRSNNILFDRISYSVSPNIAPETTLVRLKDFRHHTEEYNLLQAKKKLDEAFKTIGRPETVLVLDADKTLAAVDVGNLFWNPIYHGRSDPLKELFGGPLGYSYIAFRQPVLEYEGISNKWYFDEICEKVVADVRMHPEFVYLLGVKAKTSIPAPWSSLMASRRSETWC